MSGEQPAKRISARGLKVWRITGAIYSIIILIVVLGAGVAFYFLEWPLWIVYIAAGIVVVLTILNIFTIPTIRWRRWRYEVREQEIELQHGIFIITRTLVPMVRVQHVDTTQGPLLRKYDLATIQISTAATQHEIPAVDLQEAEEMRHAISRLARVAEDDV
ncbi:PH domain-containing protein [Lederbergia galactosidilytica]|uniref:Membrane protein n=1 Tax=Lederbergia galactosidilytica TaxID=217031 RepID=A0A178A880_9BACI|nr:PH domain-containing protein [Lederbergia galactosidilytica]KRG16207.1 membrane protein [Virgibacillus soli]MBP1914087.1 membrane protein YdbS with pleckstrin-like domain [Lederbergia galactosidilytica]OAK75640.1 membrane protein [Lederbergia galactosidilytica]